MNEPFGTARDATSTAAPPPPPVATSVREHASTFSRFALVGAAKTAVDFTVFNLILLLTTSPHPAAVVIAANTLAFVTATMVSFPANARFAFRRRARGGGIWIYLVVSLAGLAAYDAAVGVQLFALHAHGVIALNAIKVSSLAASLTVNYVGYRRLVFTHQHVNVSDR